MLRLDRYALRFKQMGHTDYYCNYINRRELKHYGTKHAHASVDVLMGDSNAPVQNAVITVSGVTIQSKTDNNGHCTVSPVPQGMHSITVTAKGFPTPVTTEAQAFIKGKPTYFTVNMNEFNVPTVKEIKTEKATA